MKLKRYGFLLAVAVILTSGCKDDPNPCDSTSYYDGTGCMPYTDAALPQADSAPAGEAAALAIDAEMGEAGASKLGMPCSDNVTHAECQGPDTDYCAVQPGSPGYCTKSGCVTDADCPTGWTCFDLSKMGITGYPAMCTMPRT
jgi:hypothetical protein